jgi:hypothetical protein
LGMALYACRVQSTGVQEYEPDHPKPNLPAVRTCSTHARTLGRRGGAVAYWGKANTRRPWRLDPARYVPNNPARASTGQHSNALGQNAGLCAACTRTGQQDEVREEHHSSHRPHWHTGAVAHTTVHSVTRSNQVEPAKTNPPSHQMGPSAAYGCVFIGCGYIWSVPLPHHPQVEPSITRASSSLVGVATSAKVVLPPICLPPAPI